MREKLRGVLPATSYISRSETGRLRWWTFAGRLANAALAEHLPVASGVGQATNLSVGLADGVAPAEAFQAVRRLQRSRAADLLPSVSPRAITGLKFNECLPTDLALATLADRARDDHAVQAVLDAPVA